MRIETNSRGDLYLVEPRGMYWVVALVTALLAVLLAIGNGNKPGEASTLPPLVRGIALGFAVLMSAGCAWWARYGWPLAFDRDRRAVLRGKRVLAGFDDIDHIAIVVIRTEDSNTYAVELRRHRGLTLRAGWYQNDLEASRAAAAIAGVTGKPVKVA